jgi:hypothetical protein
VISTFFCLELTLASKVGIRLPQNSLKSLAPATQEQIDEVGYLRRRLRKLVLHVSPPLEAILILPAEVVLDHLCADYDIAKVDV